MEGGDQTDHVLIFRQTFCMSKIHCYVVSVNLRRIKGNFWETRGHMWKKTRYQLIQMQHSSMKASKISDLMISKFYSVGIYCVLGGKKQTKKPQYQKWNARPFLKKLLILLSYPEMSDASFTFERDREINVFPKRFLSFIAPVLEGDEAKVIWAVLTAPQASLYNFVSEK